MSLLDEFESVRAASDFMVDTMRHPIRNAALFYALYFATEIKDNESAAFDFFQIKDELWKAFRIYTAYALFREMSTLSMKYVFRFESDIGSTAVGEMPPDALRDHVRTTFDDLNMAQEQQVIRLFTNADELREYRGAAARDEVEALLRYAEQNYRLLSAPDTFATIAAPVFRNEYETGAPETEGWQHSYGGDAWAGVADHFQRRQDFTKTVWINQSWAIQHNNSVFLDKIPLARTEREIAVETWEHLTGSDFSEEFYGKDDVFSRNIQRLLDMRKEGEMGEVWIYAEQYADEVDVSFRQLGRVFDIDMPTTGSRRIVLTMATGEYDILVKGLFFFNELRTVQPLASEFSEADTELSMEDLRDRIESLYQTFVQDTIVTTDQESDVQVEVTNPEARALTRMIEDARRVKMGIDSYPSAEYLSAFPQEITPREWQGVETTISRQM